MTPPSLPDWLEQMLQCPVCGAGVQRESDGYACLTCARTYPIRFGIPDFRLAPDPYISVEREVEKIDALLGSGASTLGDLFTEYYRLSPENPPILNRFYVASMNQAVVRGDALLAKLAERFPDAGTESLLDVGCGTAGMTAAAARRYRRVVGIDVALRWLRMGRQRLQELDLDVPLICANAEALPFRSDAFGAVVADAVVEHVRSSDRMRDETLRVLKPGGAYFFTTNNRYSVLPEPHVRLLGFGWLPRSMMERTAWRLRRTPYKARLHSRRELDRLAAGVGDVLLPWFLPGELGPARDRWRRWWQALCAFAPTRLMLNWFSPMFFLIGRKPPRG